MKDLIIRNGVLFDCLNKDIKSIVVPEGVTTIDNGAFFGCDNLKTIAIPNSVTSIGSEAFCGCTGLKRITIPDNVTSIGEGAFSGCSSLVSITIPDSVTSIGERTFSNCRSLTNITIPNSVTNIGDSAFYRCDNLKSKVKNYKAFDLENGNLSCRYTSFSPKEWSNQIDDIELCRRGYHYCTNLFDIFNYYFGEIDKDIAIYECEVGDVTRSRRDGDSKHVTNKIKPVKRLYREDIIRILNGQA